jgi:hypothetical protein
MSEKKEIEIWGRPLEKMTTKDLKAVALEAGGIFGVSGMKKEQLVDALRKAKDIEAAPMKTTDASTRQLKAQIRGPAAGGRCGQQPQDGHDPAATHCPAQEEDPACVGLNRVLQNKHQAVSQGVRRFGKRSICSDM